MRIYIFTEYYPSTFKPYFDTQFAQLVRDGHEITIFAFGTLDRLRNEAVVEFGLDRRTRYYPTTLRTLPRYLPRAAATLLRHPRTATRLASVREGGRGGKHRLVHSFRALSLPAEPPDLCFIHGTSPAAKLPWLKAIYPGVPIALYYHGGELPRSGALVDPEVEQAFRGADVVFTNTTFSREHAISRGCPPEKVVVGPVGFSLDDYTPPTARMYRPHGTLRLLSAGRMSEEKGHRYALEALRLLVAAGARDIRYTLVGDGYLRPELGRLVAEGGLSEYVEFAGALSTRALISRIGEADAVVLPSIHLGNWVENQACIVQEAMLMKAVVVATATGGVPESLSQGMQRFLVPPEDPEALKESLQAVRSLTDEEMRGLGEEARSFAEERYDIRRLNDAMLARCMGPAG